MGKNEVDEIYLEEIEKEDRKKKKNEKKKKCKTKKSIRILKNLFSILIFVAMVFLIYTIFLISGIETEIRYIVMSAIFVANLLFIILLRRLMRRDCLIKYIIFLLLSSILIVGQGIVGYYIHQTYSSLNSINKDKITYETAIVVKNGSKALAVDGLKDKKIGITVDNTSIDGYIMGLEIIEEYGLDDKNVIVEYESFSELIKGLYNDTVDAIIISSNYPDMFDGVDEYSNIKEETKIIHTKEKTLTKDEIALYTGDEVVNFNTSDSVTKPFTVLVMGVDSTNDTLDKNATGNGDSLMLVTFNPKTLNATILSIPRDTYVPIACFAGQKENKITHAAWNGESCMIRTIQNFTGINIDYYVKINFKGVVKLVDALGGIDVNVPEVLDGVCEQNSNRVLNTVCFKKGPQTLNGEEALAMARHRKTLLTGDFQRGVHQQLVVQGMLNKLKTIRSANQALEILDAVSSSMDTNFSTKQLLSFYDIAKNIILTSSSDNLINLQRLYLTGSGQYIYDEGIGMVLYNFIPNQSSLDQITNAMKNNLNEEHDNNNKSMSFSIEKNYQMDVIGENATSATKLYSLLPSFIGKDISYAKSWLEARNIKVTIEEKEITDNSFVNGQVMKQSLPESKRIDLIDGNGITLEVAKVIENDDSNLENEPDNENNNDIVDNENNEGENNNTPPSDQPSNENTESSEDNTEENNE